MGKKVSFLIICLVLAVIFLPGIACNQAAGQPEGRETTPVQASPGAEVTPKPNWLLPDLQVEEPDELFIVANNNTHQRELWFSNIVINTGEGPLEMTGTYDEETGLIRATQRIYTGPDSFDEVTVGFFVYHDDHDHWHFEDWVSNEIFTFDSDGQPERLVATSAKLSSCILDHSRLDEPPANSPESAVYADCYPDLQGLSSGWRDVYDADTPGQQIGMENLPDGRYLMRITADPENRIVEADEDNNTYSFYFEIEGDEVRVISGP